MVGVGQPAVEVGLRQPASPADLKPLIEVKLINREQNINGRKDAEITELVDEGIPVLVLQRVVEGIVPGIEQDIDPDNRKFDHNDCRQQNAPGPAIVRIKIWAGNPPNDSERCKCASHGQSPVGSRNERSLLNRPLSTNG